MREDWEQVLRFVNRPEKCVAEAGFPYKNFIKEYDVYSIVPTKDASLRVFESIVAPIEQGAYKAKGGAVQTMVPNLGGW